MKKTAFIILLLCAFNVFALDETQKPALQAAALAEPSIATYIAAGNDTAVAEWFNAESAYVVWKTNLQEQDIYNDAGFNFTLVDGLSTGRRDEWSNFIFKGGTCNPSKPNIRAGFADVWNGTAARNAVLAAVLALSKRNATNAEKALATGAGTTNDPGLLTFEGFISSNDVSSILRP